MLAEKQDDNANRSGKPLRNIVPRDRARKRCAAIFNSQSFDFKGWVFLKRELMCAHKAAVPCSRFVTHATSNLTRSFFNSHRQKPEVV
jgi:hypothetical protein